MSGDQLDLDAIEARADSTHAEVVRQCEGGRWLMSIPARPGYDSDLIISETVRDVEALVAEVRRLREDRDRWKRAENAQTDLLHKVFAALGGDPVRDKVDELAMETAAEVLRLRAKVERVEAAVSDNGPRTMMLADDVRAALDGA